MKDKHECKVEDVPRLELQGRRPTGAGHAGRGMRQNSKKRRRVTFSHGPMGACPKASADGHPREEGRKAHRVRDLGSGLGKGVSKLQVQELEKLLADPVYQPSLNRLKRRAGLLPRLESPLRGRATAAAAATAQGAVLPASPSRSGPAGGAKAATPVCGAAAAAAAALHAAQPASPSRARGGTGAKASRLRRGGAAGAGQGSNAARGKAGAAEAAQDEPADLNAPSGHGRAEQADALALTRPGRAGAGALDEEDGLPGPYGRGEAAEEADAGAECNCRGLEGGGSGKPLTSTHEREGGGTCSRMGGCRPSGGDWLWDGGCRQSCSGPPGTIPPDGGSGRQYGSGDSRSTPIDLTAAALLFDAAQYGGSVSLPRENEPSVWEVMGAESLSLPIDLTASLPPDAAEATPPDAADPPDASVLEAVGSARDEATPAASSKPLAAFAGPMTPAAPASTTLGASRATGEAAAAAAGFDPLAVAPAGPTAAAVVKRTRVSKRSRSAAAAAFAADPNPTMP